jgi:hypothetical protein
VVEQSQLEMNMLSVPAPSSVSSNQAAITKVIHTTMTTQNGSYGTNGVGDHGTPGSAITRERRNSNESVASSLVSSQSFSSGSAPMAKPLTEWVTISPLS